jgi:UDP:flavonoid glycosyltransferase YjiC (YdhE family)
MPEPGAVARGTGVPLLCFALNHDGLGHASRLVAICSELRARWRHDAWFLVQHENELIEADGFVQLPVPVDEGAFVGNPRMSSRGAEYGPLEGRTERFLAGVIGDLGTRLVVHDHAIWRPLFGAAVTCGLAQVLVLRPRPDMAEYARRLAGPSEHLRGVILAQGAPSDLDALRCEVVATEQIVRRSAVEPTVSWPDRDGARPLHILVCAGGGGFPDAETYFGHCLRAIAGLDEPCDVAVVTGPLFTGSIEVPAGFPHRLRVCRFERNLRSVLDGADVVVSQAGYNTTGEFLAAGTPVVVVPGGRVYDDQHRRAAASARSSPRVVVAEPGAPSIAEALTRCRQMARRAAAGRSEDAGRLAAAEFLARVLAEPAQASMTVPARFD